MKYQSTRGGITGLSFEDVSRNGYASDGGLFVPESIPRLSEDTLKSWKDLSYPDIVKRVAKLFIEDEIPSNKLDEIVDTAFTSFPDAEKPIGLKTLSNGMLMLEMYHGKTLAFKDLSMCCAARILEYFLKRANSTATFLIATSGDTGSAALEAMSVVKGCYIVVMLPRNRISPVQELLMTTVIADNCQVIRVDGPTDDADAVVKKAFLDSEFAQKYNLGSLNSVNWCRVMITVAQHFYSYFQGKKLCGDKEPLEFIPSGGLGNATAACIAHEMGLPMKIVCSVTNDAILRAVKENDYSAGTLIKTLAPAIDLQVPENWERILYLMSGLDTELVRNFMSEYETAGKASTPSDILSKIQEFMEVTMVTDDEILETIRTCYKENDGYAICPHTATALAAASRHPHRDTHTSVILGVASAEKFSESIVKSGVEWKGRDLLTDLREKKSAYVDWEKGEDWYGNLREIIVKMLD